jgi:hypothetical protein
LFLHYVGHGFRTSSLGVTSPRRNKVV